MKYDDSIDAWDRQPDEPSKWFARFDVYRLLGPSRSIGKAYRKWRIMDGRENVQITGNAIWVEQGKLWDWDARAEAWDEIERDEQEARAHAVLNDGLSLAHERIEKLKKIAQKLEDFILDAKTTRISPFVIEQYRGILDDIAKEKGERLKETRIVGASGGPVLIETSWGRGGSASDAWKQIEAPVIDTIVEEIKESTNEE